MGETPPEPLITLRGNMAPIQCLFFEIDNSSESLYASTQSGMIHKWNLKTSREEYQVQVGDGCCLCITRLGDTFVTQEKGGLIRTWQCQGSVWKLQTETCLDYWGFCKIDVFEDKLIVCPDAKSTANIMTPDGSTESHLRPPGEKCGEIMALKCVKISATDYVFVLYESGTLVLFDTSGNCVSDLKWNTDCPMCLDFFGDKGIVGSSGDELRGFRLTEEMQLVEWKQVKLTNPGVSCVCVRPDGRVVAAAGWDGRLRIFSLKSLRLLAALDPGPSGALRASAAASAAAPPLQAVTYSASPVNAWQARHLLAASSDSTLSLWSIY